MIAMVMAMSCTTGTDPDSIGNSAHTTTAAGALPAADAPPPRLVCPPSTRAAPIMVDGDPGWACTDQHGKRNGPFFTLFPDGGTQLTGTFHDDQLTGTWRRMFRNGKTSESGDYVAGLKDGVWQLYTDNGGLLGDYRMTAGAGMERRWYFDGQLASERQFNAGVLDGPSVVYGNGGIPVYEAHFRAGQLDGRRRIGRTGTMRVEDHWVAGVPRGPRRIWRREFLALETHFDEDGLPVGPFAAWRDRVSLREHGSYLRGDRHGVWRWYDRGGSIEREGNYFLGLRHGPWREWVGGRLAMAGRYVKGRPHGTFSFWNSFGTRTGTFVMRSGTGVMRSFHDNGVVATKMAMVRGVRSGPYQEFSPRGRVLVEGSFLQDLRHGPWLERDSDGNRLREASYRDGKLDGVVRRFSHGQLAVEITYVAGLREGIYRELRPRRAGAEAYNARESGESEMVRGSFSEDRKSGEWVYRDNDGRPAMVANYQDGELHGLWQQLESGQVVVRGQYEHGRRSGTWSWTGPAGTTVRTVSYDQP